MKYTVFQSTDFRATCLGDVEAIKKLWPEHYTKVADVDSISLEDTFKLTNSAHTPWTDNKGVLAVYPNCRSTSVGDIIVEGNNVFVIAMTGFIQIGEVQ